MKPRDLHFATYHQAAHVVAALVVGCSVQYVEIGAATSRVGWNLDSAHIDDVGIIYGAGFQMEQMLGRRLEVSWTLSEDDRATLAGIYGDRTGISLTPAEIDERFQAGAASSEAILNHTAARHAIDELAELLTTVYLRGDHQLGIEDFQAITYQVTGVAAS